MVPSLAVECRDIVKGSNAFSILLHAQKFEDKDLEERCCQVIETHTAEAVKSDEFVTLEEKKLKGKDYLQMAIQRDKSLERKLSKP